MNIGDKLHDYTLTECDDSGVLRFECETPCEQCGHLEHYWFFCREEDVERWPHPLGFDGHSCFQSLRDRISLLEIEISANRRKL